MMLAAGGSSSSALQFRGGAVALPVNPADVPALEIKLGALVVLLSITLVFGFAPLCIVRGTGRCSINSDNYTDLCQQREAFIKGEDIWKREEDRGGKRKIKPNSRWMDNEEESQQSKKAADQMIEDLKKDLMARQKDLESPTEYEESSDDELPSRNWSKAQRQIKPLIAENKRLKEDNFKHPIEAMKADIQQKDREVLELLQERVTLFSDLMQVTAREESGEDRCVETRTSCCRNLFRADTPHAPKAEQLLLAAIGEVDKLTTMLSSFGTQKPSVTNGNQEISNGDCGSLNGSFKLNNSTSKDKNGNQLQEGALNREVHQRLVDLSTQLHALQAAVIRQDSILELAVGAGPISSTTSGSAPGPRLSRSMSRDTGLDASGEVVLLQRQVELLQEELARLRLKAEESNKKGSGTGKKKRNKNKNKADVTKDEQLNKKSSSKDPEPHPLAPLATEDPLDQLDGVEELNEEEEEVMKISPRSDSPRDLQDIPEESES